MSGFKIEFDDTELTYDTCHFDEVRYTIRAVVDGKWRVATSGVVQQREWNHYYERIIRSAHLDIMQDVLRQRYKQGVPVNITRR